MAADRPQRGRVAAAALAAVVALSVCVGAGWVAASSFESPEQRQAAAQPPTPGEVVVAVRSGVLEERTTAQAVVGDASTTTVRIPTGTGLAVVTGAPVAVGSPVAAGSVVLEVSGRPVFALAGAFPFYRDLSSGDTGPDVEQLQTALRDLGHLRGRATGTFDAATEAAVRRLYKAAGYDPALVVRTPAAAAGDQAGTGQTGAGQATGDQAGAGQAGAGQADPPAAGTADVALAPVVAPRPTVSVPLTDLTVVARLPQAFVQGPGVGTVLSAESGYVLSDGTLVASSVVPASVSLQMKEGSAATLTDTAGTVVTGRVGTSAPEGTEGGMRVLYVTDAPLPPSWRGVEVLATITLESVGQESLLVPNRAVVPTGGGGLTVLRRTPDGTFTTVAVTRLGTLAGQSAVVPVEAGTLAVGDEVRVR